jgi:hypothetical protein
MRELAEFLSEDTDNFHVNIERKMNDPLYDNNELDELISILVMMKFDILELMEVLDDTILVRRYQERMNKWIKDMEKIIANDLDSPFRNLIWGMQHGVDLLRTK